jgi:AraC-like DNA-binding protein
VNPANYLRLRRLHLVRRKLTTTRREECTVSAAAASLGFFEFGRFAGEYRAMFGELPSQTQRARRGGLPSHRRGTGEEE